MWWQSYCPRARAVGKQWILRSTPLAVVASGSDGTTSYLSSLSASPSSSPPLSLLQEPSARPDVKPSNHSSSLAPPTLSANHGVSVTDVVTGSSSFITNSSQIATTPPEASPHAATHDGNGHLCLDTRWLFCLCFVECGSSSINKCGGLSRNTCVLSGLTAPGLA